VGFTSDILNSDQGRFILGNLVSTEDDLSDVSTFYQRKAPTAETEYTLCDLTDGPKTVLSIGAIGDADRPQTPAGNPTRVRVTVDGTASDYPSTNDYWARDRGGDPQVIYCGYPIRYDSSMKVEWLHGGDGDESTVWAWILGSGPYNIAVVKDGEPVYITASNLSEETIEGMNVLSNYRIVRNPDITHPDPQNRGMWDDDKEKVVDHPYWKPFHDTLDKLDAMRRRVGSQGVLEEIKKNPTSFENMLEGENPMEDPVEEAIQFWYERERKESVSLSELDRIR